jgi:hypothetical protein
MLEKEKIEKEGDEGGYPPRVINGQCPVHEKGEDEGGYPPHIIRTVPCPQFLPLL